MPSPTITNDGAVVTIAMSSPLAARLFGVPFLVVGGYLTYQLTGAVVDLVTGRAAVAEMIAGTLLLAIMAAAFVGPGWLLVMSRARLEVDRVAGSVAYVRDFRLHQWRHVRPLSDFSRLEVDWLTVAPNRRSRSRSFQVELVARDRKNLVAGLFDDGEEAMGFARHLGEMLALPVADVRDREGSDDR